MHPRRSTFSILINLFVAATFTLGFVSRASGSPPAQATAEVSPVVTDTPTPIDTPTPDAPPVVADTPAPADTPTLEAPPVVADTPAPADTPTPEVPVVVSDTPTPQGDQGGSVGQKASLARLTNLVLASSASGAQSVLDTSYLKKLDSHLQDLVSAQLSGENVSATAQSSRLTISEGQAVLMDIYVSGSPDQAASQLEGLGMQVLATNASLGQVVEGYLPLESVLPAARLEFTRALMPVYPMVVGTGSVTSQGDAAHLGPAARALGTTGAGVVVGIISDSMNEVGSGLAGSKATGDLPASVTVLADGGAAADEDEGRAMAEIIYDTAPGITSMYFNTAHGGPASKAAAISSLVSHGAKVIADDTTYYQEPFFQDGQISQAVDAAYASGTAYFVSAGNEARQSYEHTYANMPVATHWGVTTDNWHDFDPNTVSTDWLQTIGTVEVGNCITVWLQWDDPWGAASHDFDFYLGTSDGTTLLDSSEADNIFDGLPYEDVSWCNKSGQPGYTGSPVSVGDSIGLYAGPATGFLKTIAYKDFGSPFSYAEYPTNSDTIAPEAASATGALTVAAVNWNDSGLNDPEAYSSRGPKTRLFDKYGNRAGSPEVRQKPNIAGADCVITSSNFSGGTGFNAGDFCGTSAAAPSVAGVAALVWAMRPTLSVGQLYSALTNPANTIDCTLAGQPDTDCGWGFVLANSAVASVRPHPRAKFDFSGDGQADIGIYRPSTGTWYIQGYGNAVWGGVAGDIPLTADFTGDGRPDVGIYRPSTGTWYIQGYGNAVWGGAPGDIPLLGDFTGDGKADVGIYRPSNGTWYIQGYGNAVWGGVPGDIPLNGDFTGDGKADVGIYRPSTGTWYIQGFGNAVLGGVPGDIPVPADYTGDGKTDVAIYRPSTGTWYIQGYGSTPVWGGVPGDIPVPADYNGDGKAEIAVYRPSNGTWYVNTVGNGVFGGVSGDYPLEAPDTNGNGTPYQ